MNKTTHNKLIQGAAAESGLDENLVRRSTDAYLKQVAQSVLDGTATPLYRVGTLYLAKANPKRAWSFSDKKVVTLPERKIPKMTFTRNFVHAVQDKK